MLYPKKNERELSLSLFKDPTAEYRAAPFWAWNCELERKELNTQIEGLCEMGFGGFHMHVRSGLASEYLGEEFMDLVASCVEKAKSTQMLAWLYDEDRWPSGCGGGLVTKEKKYRRRYLLFTKTPYTAEELVCNPTFDPGKPAIDTHAGRRGGQDKILLATYDVVQDEAGSLLSYRRLSEGGSVPLAAHGFCTQKLSDAAHAITVRLM